ncbi:MAG TPA: hypothetical protein DCE41_24080 [Cytophagales bacterium]|nr:hypothetical protein [Cytophagales bacterium]HAA18813.1 hypothetical protein [Cytophagales bacterium]HAP64357.1 hypothetical protein [Cytophagales bacterium]
MHLNYYFLRQWVAALEPRWVGWKLGECFTQAKGELILGFYRAGESWYLKVAMQGDFAGLALAEEFHRAKRNNVDLFTRLIDLEVVQVEMMENERVFALHFEQEETLLFKMHGNRSNVLSFKAGELNGMFKHKLVQDKEIQLDQLHRHWKPTQETWLAANGHIFSVWPTLGKEPLAYLIAQGFEQQTLEEQWNRLEALRPQLESPSEYLICTWKGKPTLSLVPVGEIEARHDNPIEAANDFFYRYTRVYHLQRELHEATARLRQKLRRSYNYLDKTRNKLEELQQGMSYHQLGDILMANLHAIPPQVTKVTLDNFYAQEPITIKLKKDLSPQKNAEVYYRKAKNQRLEIAQLEKSIRQKENEILEQEEHQEALGLLDSVRSLRQYLKKHKLTQEHDGSTDAGPYRRYAFMGYEIWVGKSAKHNDELTQRYATKEDLWLHAKDVAGSHVIIKHKPGQNYPELVIERAAELAAFYSKRKHDSLCPVIYTPKKYVRKPKGAPAGAVVVDREEVVMVEPARES